MISSQGLPSRLPGSQSAPDQYARKTVILTRKDKLSTTESLNSIEERLHGNNFFRSPRAYIVNLNMVREIRPWGKNSYEITFSGTQQKALLASNKARELEKILALPGS